MAHQPSNSLGLNILRDGYSNGADELKGHMDPNKIKGRTELTRPLECPLVIFIDIDGTIIGDIQHMIAQRDIVASFCGDHAQSRLRMKAEQVSRMRHGVIRPRFDAFVKKVIENNKEKDCRRVELFVYTASEDAWALHVVGLIETAVGFKVNRPIFSRRHCLQNGDGTFSKSLTPLVPFVMSALKRKKYAVSSLCLANSMILIDNNPSVVRNSVDECRLVSCPTYNFATAYDVLSQVHVDVIHERYELIARALVACGLYPSSSEKDGGTPRSPRHFLRVYYSSLASRLRKSTRSANGAELRDRFWVRMRNALFVPSLVVSLDTSHVRSINRRLKV